MESNGHSNTCPKLHLACSCACLHCPVLSCKEKEGDRKEREEREGERRRKKFGRQGRPAKAFWKNLKLKTRAPEQYDHREYCSGALVFNFKSYIVLGQKKWILQLGVEFTVVDVEVEVPKIVFCNEHINIDPE